MKYIFFLISVTLHLTLTSQPSSFLPPEMPTDFSFLIPNPWGEYYDSNSAGHLFVEAWWMKNVENEHNNGHLEILKMMPVLFAEISAMGPLNRVNKQINAISYITLCDNFVGGALNRKKKLCIEKRDYIIKASKVVTDLINNGTRFPVNNGIEDQINQRYTEIINMLNDELNKMQLEKERRSVVERLFRS